MIRRILIAGLLAAPLWAQPTVAPTNEPVGNPRGENTAEYNIRQSFELGYRWRAVDGSLDMYRSTVNFGNGIRLLNSSISVQSRDGHGRFFDQIVFNTQGLGNDPYQSASLRVEKNRFYRYDVSWRSIAYFNPGLRAPEGQHLRDTERHLQDQDLTLFPLSRFKFFLGYSRNTESGPGISTANLFDATRGDEFPLFANIQREQNEYRLGTDVTLAGFRINVMHAWVNFKEDTPFSLDGNGAGNDPTDPTTVSSFRRNEPYHGNSPYWRVMLFREKKWWAANGRFTYVAGRRGFVTDELDAGTNRLGSPIQRQIISYGDANRPAATGNLTFSIFPTDNITLTNQTSFYNIRMQGNSYFAQVDNNGIPRPVVNFEYLGIRTLSNSTDLDFRFGSRFAIHTGYVYDNRFIRSVQGFQTATIPPDHTPDDQTNQLHAGVIGFRIRPIKILSISLDAEIGRADNPFYPVSEKNYQALRGRIELKRKSIRTAVYYGVNYNTNAASLANYASRSRQYGADFTWTARTWFSVDASYGKQHLDTLAAIDYFALADTRIQEVPTDRSYYVSSIHTATLAARFDIRDRVDVSIGYSHIQDLGDGRAVAVVASPNSALPAFVAAQTFPLRFASPSAKISILIAPKVRWNAGYQFYGYREDFATLANYRAHTGYTSVSWSF